MTNSILKFAHRMSLGMASRARNTYFRALGVEIREYCWMRKVEIPRNWTDIILDGCSLDRGVTLLCSGPERRGKLEIGNGTYVNRNTMFDAHARLSIGRDVMIGPFCYFTDANHGMSRDASVKSQSMHASEVIIEDEAWIGANVTVLSGVRIGRGAVIGAGSVVTKSIPSMAIAYGSPAKAVRERS